MSAHDPRRLDVERFTAQGDTLAGEWPLASFGRLASAGAAERPPARWSAAGTRQAAAGREPERWLHLQGAASVVLECQRCLQPMVQALQVDRRFQFVRDEQEAERLDEEAEHDVLMLPRRLDLHELLEDELILALPVVPRHDHCAQPLPVAPHEVPPADEEPHPFAALAALRRSPEDPPR